MSNSSTEGTAPGKGDGESAIKRRWLAVRIFWVLLLLGLAAFLIAANVVGSTAPSSTKLDLRDHTTYALPILMVLLLLSSRIQSRIAADLDPLIGRLMRLVFAVPAPHRRVKRPSPSSWLGMIWIGLLCEAVALLGFVFFLFGGYFPWLYISVAIAAVALVYLRPRKKDLIDDAANESNRRPDKPDMTGHGLRGRTVVILFCVAFAFVALVLGVAFVLMMVGLMPGVAILIVVVQDRQATRKLFGKLPYHRAVWLIARVLVPTGFGIYFLIDGGFCGQNLICMLLR